MAKKIIIKRPIQLPGSSQNKAAPLRATPIYGIWAKVIKRTSKSNTVDVETAEGFQITNIPVMSKDWVSIKKIKGKILGNRDLPPVDTLVFIILPAGNLETAFIMSSGFVSSYDEHTAEFLVEGKEEEELSNTEGGWTKKVDKATGDIEVVGTDDDDKTLTITIKKSTKKIQLKDWNDNDIVIDENGLKVTDTKGNKATWNDSGIVTEDKNGNKITMDSSGMKAVDKNGQSVEMAAAGMTLKSTTQIKIDCPAGISIVTSDSSIWQPNIVPACPFGFPHGGPGAGITVMKGS